MQNENLFIHTAGMMHLFIYMKFQVFYKINQCIVLIIESFDHHHEVEYFRAVIFLKALDLDEHVLILLYVTLIQSIKSTVKQLVMFV